MLKEGSEVIYPFTKNIAINRDPYRDPHQVDGKFTTEQNTTGKENDKPQIEFEALERYMERTASSNDEFNPEYRSETVLFNRKFKFPE